MGGYSLTDLKVNYNETFAEGVFTSTALGGYFGRMLLAYALGVCFGRMLWVYALSVCFGHMLWAYALGVCFGRMLSANALGVYFVYMALQRISWGPSLWVRGFGHMSLGVWILPKKPEAKY